MNRLQHIHTTKHLLAGLLLPLLAAACTADGIEPVAEGPVAVTFSPAFARVITRSTIDNEWADSTEIVVRCSEAGQADKDYTYQYDATEDTWTATDDSQKYYWPINDPSWTFSAWPASYGTSPLNTKEVADNQSTSNVDATAYEGYDLLYCPPDGATFRQPVTLAFQHLMSRVVVIVNSSSTDEKEKVTNIDFGGGHVGLKGSADLTTSPVTWTLTNGQASTITMRSTTSDEEEDALLFTYECILPPQSYDTGSDNTLFDIIVITTKGESNEEHTYKYSGRAITMLPGNQYTYSLSVTDGSKILVSTLQVVPWTSSTVSSCAEYGNNNYPTENVTE